MADPSVEDRQKGDPPPPIPGGSSLPDVSYGLGGYPLQSYAPDSKDSPTDISKLVGPTGSLTEAQRDYTAKTGQTYNQMDSLINADVERAHKAYDATGIGPDEFPKWNEAEERAKFLHNPMDAFGSTASIFAILASAFTRAPMENALNGSAAAMSAIRSNDKEAYENAHRAWKENTDLALKRHEMMREHYSDALQLMNTDLAAGRAKLQNYAAQYGDQQTLTLMEAGLDERVFKLMDDRNKSIVTAQDTANKLDENKIRWSIYQKALSNSPNPDDPQTQMNALSAAFGLNETAQQMAAQNFFITHPNATAEETQNFLKSITGWGATAALKAPQIEQIERGTRIYYPKVQAEHPEWSPDEVEYEARQRAMQDVTRATHADKPAPVQQQELRARVQHYEDEALKQNPGMDPWEAHTQAYNRAAGEVKGADQPKTGLLSDDALNIMAERYVRTGDQQVFTNLGRGHQGAENITRLWDKIAQKMKEQGKTANDIAVAKAEFEGFKSAERGAGTRMAQIGLAAREAVRLAKPALDESEKVSRTKFPTLNEAELTARTLTGDPEAVRFKAAVNSFLQAYTRAIAPTGVPTDLVRKHAYELLSTAFNKDQFRGAMEQLRIEMDAAMEAPGDLIREFRRTYGDGAVPGKIDDVWGQGSTQTPSLDVGGSTTINGVTIKRTK